MLEWLTEERGVTFVMRLHTLVAEKCDDIAMSLATAVMERVRADAITSDDKQSEEPKGKALVCLFHRLPLTIDSLWHSLLEVSKKG